MRVEEGLESDETLFEVLGRVPVVCSFVLFAVLYPAAEEAFHSVHCLAYCIVGSVDDII